MSLLLFQGCKHFNVLVERGFDSRRVIIDEAAPIYHITEGRNYPPMQIVVAENDRRNRNEQNALLVSTLKHFGCEEDKIEDGTELFTICKKVCKSLQLVKKMEN